MCGIIGYTGKHQAAPILLEGLQSLTYRGYDSAGIAVMDADGPPRVYKKAGKLDNLAALLNGAMPAGSTGIGHTRWATHGGPTDSNAHPHMDCRGEVVVAHNGIVENYIALKRELIAKGHRFSSQTDSECISHIIELYMDDGLAFEDAVRMAAREIEGANAVVAFTSREPDRIAAFRLGNAGGVVVGRDPDGGAMLSSDLPALLPYGRDVIYLSGGEMVSIVNGEASFCALDGKPIDKKTVHVPFDPLSASKGGYKHFMHKEIHEQPEVVINALKGRVAFDDLTVNLDEAAGALERVSSIRRVIFIGMGTSLHAAMVGRHWMESLARIPCEYDNSSEFRYRNPVLDEHTLVVSVCQSGETVDTLAAMELAADSGAYQITLCNYPGVQTTRVADDTILVRAGLEIGVAASKTFTSSLVALYLLAVEFGARRGVIGEKARGELIGDLVRLPDMLGKMLLDESPYEEIARRYGRRSDFLYLGRGLGFPLAMEGALKLKEISYIHAEGYPAGEMKHGPISLIDRQMPVVAIAPRDSLRDKMLSNINEVKARDGQIVGVITEGDDEIAERSDYAIAIPPVSEAITPFLVSIPMQLIAYHLATRRGCDVDQPRNLAKTVTVE